MNTPSTFWDGIDTTIATGSGGIIQSVGGYVVHEFTASANFTPATTARYEFFMVGAGGRGNNLAGGGGGGGEVVLGSVTLTSGSSYSIDFDAGSIPSELTFAGITAHAGGNGGRGGNSSQDGFDGDTGGAGTGGSGGGGGDAQGDTKRFGGDSSAANGIVNYLFRYGNDGGDSAADDGAGGGGGAVTAGEDGDQDGSFNALGGDGGDGYPNDWLGSTTYYGGGGGGSAQFAGSSAGSGGLGGGDGAVGSANAQSAAANTGGGGGGSDTGNVGLGADGIVLIRYRTSL